MRILSRRKWLATTIATLGLLGVRRPPAALGADLTVPGGAAEDRFDFDKAGVEGWTVVSGQWTVEDMEGAPSGKKVLVQRATRNEFNVIVAPPGPYTAIDVSMKFKPISGKQDASGGIVFRFADGKYYVVRANALEDNLRLYVYDQGRRQIASARVKPPAPGAWHDMRVVAVDHQMQAWLNGMSLLQHRDSRFKTGRVGLWTKADSVTAFDDLIIRGVTGGS
jgi:Domain of Unknown Function (DUF1080)